MLQSLGLLVDLVPGNAEHVGEEALDQPVAADDVGRLALAARREADRLVVSARDVAVALQAADHLVHRGRSELHRARDVGAGHRQAGFEQPVERLEVLVFADRRVRAAHHR